MDGDLRPHGDALHLKWTIRRVAKDVLHLSITLFDEAAFTEPVTTTNIWHRKSSPEWEILDDQSCFENNRDKGDSKAESGFVRF